MCYYVLVGTLVLTLFTYFEATEDEELQAIETFFINFVKAAGLNRATTVVILPRFIWQPSIHCLPWLSSL